MAALDLLAELFDELAHGQPRTALPLLVRVVDPLDEPELGVLPLEGRHPGSLLLGFTAPADCFALGVVSTGWSLPSGGHDERDLRWNRRAGPPAGSCADRVAVRSTVLVGRDGRIAGRLSIDGAEPVPSAPESGVLVDLLLRALDRPTPPPAAGTLELFASAWLVALARHAGAGDDWAGVAGHHWALQLLAGRADELTDLARALADELDWAAVRRTVARAGWPGACSAADAAWLDDGSFARWLLGSYPPLGELVGPATERLRPGVAEQVRAALAAWSLGNTDR